MNCPHRLIHHAIVLLLCWLAIGNRAAPALAALQNVHAAIGADFWIDGQPPNLTCPPNLARAIAQRKVVIWSSWCGGGPRTGQLVLGPFVAQRHFYMSVAGEPFAGGNVLKLMRRSKGDEFIITRDTPGNAWQQVEVNLPADWEGSNITVFGFDGSTAPEGWFAVTEPYTLDAQGEIQPLWKNRDTGLRWGFWAAVIAHLVFNFGLLGLIGVAGLSVLRRFLKADPSLSPLLVAGVIGLAGYADFWAYLHNPHLGRFVAVSLLILSAGNLVVCRFLLKVKFLPVEEWAELKLPAILFWIAALLYLGVLNMPCVVGTPMEVLASRRPTTWPLPSDNVLQQQLSEAIFFHRNPRIVDDAVWQTSDRPPLEAGVQLLAGTFSHGILQSGWNFNAQLSGMLLQLSWIYGIWALLRALGCSRAAASQIILCLIASPFFYINCIFIWAKLSAAAYAMGAIVILCFRGKRALTILEGMVAAALLTLGMLCHTGIFFFAFPVLGLWLILPITASRPPLRSLAIMAVTAMALWIPWMGYQKFVDPPGNHLVKLSLAGTIDANSIPVSRSIRNAYAALTPRTIIENKESNFATLFKGDWPTLFQLFPADRAERRYSAFLFLFRTLGLYVLGFALLPVLLLRQNREKLLPVVFLLSSIAISLVIWCLVMFGPENTIVHAGAYGIPLSLFTILAYLFRLTHPLLLGVVGVCNLVQFLWVYLWSAPYPPRIDALAVAVVVISGLLAVWLLWIGQMPDESHRRSIGQPRIEDPI